MVASNETMRGVVERYLGLVADGKAEEIVALFAPEATLEDPVGGTPLRGHDQLREFYSGLEGLEMQTTLNVFRACGGEAAFFFEVRTITPDATYVMAPMEVMTFDEDGLITSMRAWWSGEDMSVA